MSNHVGPLSISHSQYFQVTLWGFNYNIETIKMPIDCVDTNRPKPTDCSLNRSAEEALKTVPAHFEDVKELIHSLEAI